MSNPFVATQKQIDEMIASRKQGAVYDTNVVSASFETTMDFIAGLLPPFAQLPDKPTGFVSVQKARQHDYPGNLIGMGIPYIDLSMIGFACKYKDIKEPVYTIVAMYVDRECFRYEGREVWGAPMRSGKSEISAFGKTINGLTERNGTRLISIDLEMEKEVEPTDTVSYDLSVKTALHHQGWKNLEPQPVIVLRRIETHTVLKRTGPGVLKLTGGSFDPLGEIPIVSVGEISYSQATMKYTCPTSEIYPDAEAIKPYYVGKMYDLARD